MEGNVEFIQGDQTILADRMYYDVRNHVGTVLSADMLTPATGYEGKLRMHADVLQQIDANRFNAQGVWVTSSRLGIPSYRLQASEATFEDRKTEKVDVLGQPLIDPKTGQPAFDEQKLVTANNNVLYLEEVPIFYWPTFATDLNDPSMFIRRFQVSESGVFGWQVYTDFAAYQLLGIKNRPIGTDWTVTLDYLSYRGFAEGTEFIYDRDDFLGIPGKTSGRFRFWGIDDKGTDNLGQDRPSVEPEPDVNYRYWLIDQHRQDLGGGFSVQAELGKISDRNFMQEYFKQDWDEQKDPTTEVTLNFRREDLSMSLWGQARLDNFVTETQWLPRFDFYLLGQSLVADKLTFFDHTSLGYADFQVATLPNPAAGDTAVSHLPWEPKNLEGGHTFPATRSICRWNWGR